MRRLKTAMANCYGHMRYGHVRYGHMARPTGIEPVSRASETLILSIELRAPIADHCSAFGTKGIIAASRATCYRVSSRRSRVQLAHHMKNRPKAIDRNSHSI